MSSVFYGYLCVFFGGGLGAMLRHGVNRLSAIIRPDFPYGTLIVNILGCFMIGLFAAWFAYRGEDTSPHARLLLITGLLGGFTTFSAFSLDTAYLWQRGETVQTLLYVGASVLVSIVAVFAGLAVMRQVMN